MSAAFAKGPWTAWVVGRTVCILGPDCDHDKPIVAWMGFDGCNRPLAERKRNANLIAAAPEMYEALAAAVANSDANLAAGCPRTGDFKKLYDKAVAALVKARGEQ